MKTGYVVGQLVCTLKHPDLEGYRLLVVEPAKHAGLSGGDPLVCVDLIGAGIGEHVLLIDDGSSAKSILSKVGPIRAMITGIVDEAST